MLKRAEGKISDKAYKKYLLCANNEFRKMKNRYLMDSIQSLYANFVEETITGGVALNLSKVIEIINYYAANVTSLHKVKVMKMLWYGDSLSYKRRGKSITGLVYCALPMGAVPEGYEQILDLDGIAFDTVLYDNDRMGYKFYPVDDFEISELTLDDIRILDAVIQAVGHLNSQEIINKMHDEDAYKYTDRSCIIPFTYAKNLTID